MIRAVLFDLDGTLVDSAPDLGGALNRLRAEEGLQPLPLEELRWAVSKGGAGLVSLGMGTAEGERFEQLRDRFLKIYEQQLYRDSSLFDGVDELLDWLARQAIPWGVVTNKWERFTLPVMQQSGLMPRAGCLVCGDTLRHSKPHPAPVELACRLLGAEPAQTVMFGDDQRDIQAAQSAGARAVFASYGYTREQPEGITDSVDSARAIRAWLEMSRSGERFSD